MLSVSHPGITHDPALLLTTNLKLHAMVHAQGLPSLPLVFHQYAGGEMWLEDISLPSHVVVDVSYRPPVGAQDTLIQLGMLAILLEKYHLKCRTLQLTYTPYLRDQGMHGVSGLHILHRLVQALQPHKLIVFDAHDTAFLSQCVSPHQFFHDNLASFWADFILQELQPQPQSHWILVAADRGAAEKTRRLASLCRLPYIVLPKRRRGNHIVHHSPSVSVSGKICLLVDDMVDSGATMLSAAKLLYACGAHDVRPMVTHWLSQPAQLEALQKQFTQVYTTNSVQHYKGESSWCRIVPLESYLFEKYYVSSKVGEPQKQVAL